MTTILSIFLAALIIAYILEPISDRIARIGLGMIVGAISAMLLGMGALIGLLVLVINILQREIPQIQTQLPDWVAKSQAWLTPQLEKLRIDLDWDALRAQVVERVTQQFSKNADAIISHGLDTLLASMQTFVTGVAAIVLIAFVVFYLLIDGSKFFMRTVEFIPPRHRDTAKQFAAECDALLSQYLRGQLLVMLILAAYYATALTLVGMAGGVAIGLLTGLAIFIPYIGFGVGLVLATLSALLQFGPTMPVVLVLAVYGAGQVIEGFFLTPKLVGNRIGLHPIAVVFAMLFFGSLFGFFGVLLALPAAAITLVSLRFIRAHYEHSHWFEKPRKK